MQYRANRITPATEGQIQSVEPFINLICRGQPSGLQEMRKALLRILKQGYVFRLVIEIAAQNWILDEIDDAGPRVCWKGW